MNRNLEPKIFGFADDIDPGPHLLSDFLLLELSWYVYFSSKVPYVVEVASPLKKIFAIKKTLFVVSLLPLHVAENVPALKSLVLNISKLMRKELQIIILIQLASDLKLHEVTPPNLSLQIFSVRASVFYLQRQTHYYCSVSTTKLCNLFHQWMVTVSINKNPICFSTYFFKIKLYSKILNKTFLFLEQNKICLTLKKIYCILQISNIHWNSSLLIIIMFRRATILKCSHVVLVLENSENLFDCLIRYFQCLKNLKKNLSFAITNFRKCFWVLFLM